MTGYYGGGSRYGGGSGAQSNQPPEPEPMPRGGQSFDASSDILLEFVGMPYQPIMTTYRTFEDRETKETIRSDYVLLNLQATEVMRTVEDFPFPIGGEAELRVRWNREADTVRLNSGWGYFLNSFRVANGMSPETPYDAILDAYDDCLAQKELHLVLEREHSYGSMVGPVWHCLGVRDFGDDSKVFVSLFDQVNAPEQPAPQQGRQPGQQPAAGVAPQTGSASQPPDWAKVDMTKALALLEDGPHSINEFRNEVFRANSKGDQNARTWIFKNREPGNIWEYLASNGIATADFETEMISLFQPAEE